MKTEAELDKKEFIVTWSGIPGNRFLPKKLRINDKVKTTKKYFECKSLFKDLKSFCSEAKNKQIPCMS